MINKTQLIKDYKIKYPMIGTRQLSRVIYKDYPELFKDIEDVRVRIMSVSKRERSILEYIPEGNMHTIPTINLTPSEDKILILNDVHIPYHNKRAFVQALEHGKTENITAILLNGDIFDFYGISRWEKNPKERDFKYEVETIRGILYALRYEFPDANIYFRYGNHEERYIKYMQNRCLELFGIPEFSMESMLHFDKLGIISFSERVLIEFGGYTILHGHEIAANHIERYLQIAKKSLIVGHHHRTQYSQSRAIDGSIIKGHMIGCLSELTPPYLSLPSQWNLGYMILDSSGNINNVLVD